MKLTQTVIDKWKTNTTHPRAFTASDKAEIEAIGIDNYESLDSITDTWAKTKAKTKLDDASLYRLTPSYQLEAQLTAHRYELESIDDACYQAPDLNKPLYELQSDPGFIGIEYTEVPDTVFTTQQPFVYTRTNHLSTCTAMSTSELIKYQPSTPKYVWMWINTTTK